MKPDNRLADSDHVAHRDIYFYVLLLERKLESAVAAEKEKARGNKILQNTFPDTVLFDLKTSGKAQPVYYKECSVLFTDFVGFTKIVSQIDSGELIRELDFCFSRFDSIMDNHGLEKLKTIGDSYMCAGGLPIPSQSHAIDCALAALKMREFTLSRLEEMTLAGKPYWNIRIGIHTGPALAGVIGKKKLAYDVWGDTVNMASRMEHYSQSGEINVSPETYAQTKALFRFEAREPLEIKDHGRVRMYFLKGLKEEYQAVDPWTPNERFFRDRRDLIRARQARLLEKSGRVSA